MIRSHSNASKRAVFVGVDIGGTKTAVVLSSTLPVILSRLNFQRYQSAGQNEGLISQRRVSASRSPPKKLRICDLISIGVSCGGPLDRVAGVIQSPPNLSTWVDIPITSMLQREFGIECKIENDANAGAVAEHQFGAGVARATCFF